MSTQVRHATVDDIGWLIEQLKLFAGTLGTKRSLIPDADTATRVVTTMVAMHLVLVAELDGVRQGFIAGYVIPHPFNPAIRLLAETFWWVDEAHRGTRAGLMLLNAFVAWGGEHADWITVALEAKSPVANECLTKRGFVLQERSFLLEA